MPLLTSPRTWTRETRLLLLTLLIAGAVLAVLAQFRFPDTPRAEPPAPPLERLAARVTFDELAAIVGRLAPRVHPSVLVLRASPRAAGPALSLDDLLQPGGATAAALSFLPALRVRPDLALVLLPAGLNVQAVVGDDDAVPLVVAEDRLKGVALIRVPQPADGSAWQWQPEELPDQPRYVAAVEGTRGGIAMRPVFLGRATRFEEPRWGTPLIALGSTAAVADGAVLVSFGGDIVGMAIRDGSAVAAVPAAALATLADALLAGVLPPFDFGLTLQPLTGAIAQLAGTMTGVVVTGVADGSPAAGLLQAGDILQGIDGQPVGSVEHILARLARVARGGTVVFAVHRAAARVEVAVTAVEPAIVATAPPPWPGLTLARGAPATITSVAPGGAAALGGLAPGDTLTFVGELQGPDARAALARLSAVEPGQSLLVGSTRAGRPGVTILVHR